MVCHGPCSKDVVEICADITAKSRVRMVGELAENKNDPTSTSNWQYNVIGPVTC